MKVPPDVTAYPLSRALALLKGEGIEVRLKKTLPPGGRGEEEAWRVVRQDILDQRRVQLLITPEAGQRG